MSYVNLPALCHGRTAVYDRYIFPETEFEARAENVRAMMKARGLDGLMIYSDGLSRSHVCYLTNYYSTLSWGTSMLVFPLNGEIVNVTCLGSRDYEHTKKMVPESIELMCSGLGMITNHHVALDALDYIEKNKLGANWGGVNLNRLYAAGYDPIMEKYPQLQDVTEAFDKIKAVKNDREMYAMSQAASISEKAVNEFMRLAEAGMVETELASAIERTCKGYGVDNASFLVSAGSEDIRLHQPRLRKFEKGDILTVVVNAQFLHYNGVYAASKVIGGASDAQRELMNDAENMWKAQIDELNKTKKAFIGQKDAFCDKKQLRSYVLIHGIGVDMVEAPDADGAEVELAAGVTLGVSLNVEKEGVGGVLISRTLYVAENGLVQINGQGI